MKCSILTQNKQNGRVYKYIYNLKTNSDNQIRCAALRFQGLVSRWKQNGDV